MSTARVFTSGNSQAIRLPKEFRLDVRRVDIRREGSRLIIEPLPDDFSALFARLDQLAPGFPTREQPATGQTREELD